MRKGTPMTVSQYSLFIYLISLYFKVQISRLTMHDSSSDEQMSTVPGIDTEIDPVDYKLFFFPEVADEMKRESANFDSLKKSGE